MMMKSLTGAALLLGAAVLAPVADAQTVPQDKTQVPGYFKLMVGDVQVTALYDGSSTFPLNLFKNASPETLQREVAEVDGDAPKVVNGSVNSFLINTGEHLILIDSGGGALLGPGFGQVMRNLRAAGYQPGQVDMVLLTHMHRDHIGGLVSDDGQPAFPHATVYASQPEIDYWLSAENASHAAPDQQAAFQMVKRTLAPYADRGRLRAFTYGKALLPGLQPVSLPGHTPGHSGFMLDRGGQRILFWGDIVHYSALQFAHPELGIAYDSDSGRAIRTRETLLKQVARQKTLIAGAHITFPGIGYLRADGDTAYRWTPIGFGELR
ncbi:MBL fold metallo-hydrolase [Martelella alba]|nr:MBL fold metallo-hydrolase [Martelella alba]